MNKMFSLKYPKFQIELMNIWNKYDWYINIIPYLNFGNNEWNNKAIIINLGWIIWNVYIHINYK